jgi:hypothetical protein
MNTSEQQNIIRRLADYERLSSIFWLILGIVQIFLIWTALAGIWNIYASITRWKMPDRIRRRDPAIPSIYKNINGLVIIAIVNLLVGGLIGLLFVAFDFYIRDIVLTNAQLFSEDAHTEIPSEEISEQTFPSSRPTIDEQLRTLAGLKADKIISEEDFERKKNNILGF